LQTNPSFLDLFGVVPFHVVIVHLGRH
jgi:hypothetical protein